LTSFEERAELLEQAGLDYLAWCDFTPELAQVAAEAFVSEWLVGRMNARLVAAGPNFRFGHKAQGSPATLQAAGRFEVRIVPPVERDGAVVSSTRIRGLVAQARLDEAALLLSRPCFVTGRVEAGQQVGRQLGTPTANLAVDEWRQYPPHGVYAVRCDGWPAVANLGVRPTFGDHRARLEVHLLDRQEDLYGKLIRVDFIRHLRPEQRFPSPDALREQIGRDVAQARACLLEG
jgi:riboflavin kinase/FMN adenylyltransferase